MSHPSDTGFEYTRVPWRSWGLVLCGRTRVPEERLAKATGAGVASGAMKTLRMKRPWKKLRFAPGDWLRLTSEGRERLLVRMQHRCSGDPSILEMRIHGATAKDSSYGVEPVWARRQAACAVGGCPRPSGEPTGHSGIPEAWHWASSWWTLVFLWFECNCVLVLLSRDKKVFNLFFYFSRAHSCKT